MISAAERPFGYGWSIDLGRVEYTTVLGWQRGLVKMRESGMARDTIILVEHPPVVTVGKDGKPANYEQNDLVPVFIERGGDVTYHGPGQLVAYFIFNLNRRGRDLHLFVDQIQEGIIRTLADYHVVGERNARSTGVWVGEKKIASIGVAVKKWISFHGAAINLNTKLADFERINPCGLEPKVMTSLHLQTRKKIMIREFGVRLLGAYTAVFDTPFTPVHLDELAEDMESQRGGGHV